MQVGDLFIAITRIMFSLSLWPKVITLSSFQGNSLIFFFHLFFFQKYDSFTPCLSRFSNAGLAVCICTGTAAWSNLVTVYSYSNNWANLRAIIVGKIIILCYQTMIGNRFLWQQRSGKFEGNYFWQIVGKIVILCYQTIIGNRVLWQQWWGKFEGNYCLQNFK